MKGAALILFSAFALALCDIEVNSAGCPVDPEIHLTLPHDSYCNKFYICERGQRVEQKCPGDLVFNENEGVCDWRLYVDCGNKGIYEGGDENVEKPSNPGGNSDPSAAPEICAREDSNGVLVAHENCNQFYKCDRGHPVAFECQPGLLYNYEAGYCDWPFNVECGDRNH